MSASGDLERRYRRWLRWYPARFRREYEAELLEVLVAAARDGRTRPAIMECLSLMANGIGMRLRAAASPARTGSTSTTGIRLMYVGALLEVAAAGTVLATMSDIRAILVRRHPGFGDVQWHAVVAGQLEPLMLAACAAAAFWVSMAFAIRRGHRKALIAFGAFFGVNVYGLLDGLTRGSATYAGAALVVGVALCVVQLAAVILMLRPVAGSSRALPVAER